MRAGRARWPIRAFYTFNETLGHFGIKMQDFVNHCSHPPIKQIPLPLQVIALLLEK
jgi:hypothetical protein